MCSRRPNRFVVLEAGGCVQPHSRVCLRIGHIDSGWAILRHSRTRHFFCERLSSNGTPWFQMLGAIVLIGLGDKDIPVSTRGL